MGLVVVNDISGRLPCGYVVVLWWWCVRTGCWWVSSHSLFYAMYKVIKIKLVRTALVCLQLSSIVFPP